MSSDIALQAIDLVKHFSTGSSGVLGRATNIVHAVDGVSFTLPKGKTLGVVGESGCGKSTLARLVTRLIESSSGSVILDGDDFSGSVFIIEPKTFHRANHWRPNAYSRNCRQGK